MTGLKLILCVALWIGVLKGILKLLTAWNRSPKCLVGKTAIVTGSNTGIGFYTAQDFAKRGARVILACRNKTKAEEAREKIIKATANANIVVKVIDFASLKSVREFAKDVNTTETRLDILVNNAGVALLEDERSEDGLNLTMQINHFGPFLLTLLLIDLLKKSTPSRIVNVSSSAAVALQDLNPNDLNAFPKGRFAKIVNYANTKMCNILFTNELARKLKGSGVTANSLHPGVIRTEIIRNASSISIQIYNIVTKLLRDPEEGAQTTIYLSVSDEVENISGEYFDNCRKAWLPAMPKVGRDDAIAKKVWKKSEAFVKLTSEERKL